MHGAAIRHAISVAIIAVAGYVLSVLLVSGDRAAAVGVWLGVVVIAISAYLLGFRFGMHRRTETGRRPLDGRGTGLGEGAEALPTREGGAAASSEEALRKVDELCEQVPINSDGRLLTRDELHERR